MQPVFSRRKAKYGTYSRKTASDVNRKPPTFTSLRKYGLKLPDKVADEDDEDDGRDNPADEEVEELEEVAADGGGAAAGKLVVYIGFLHAPADEEDEGQGAEGHEDVRAHEVADFEDGEAEELDAAKGAEGEGAECAEHQAGEEEQKHRLPALEAELLHRVLYAHFEQGDGGGERRHEDGEEEDYRNNPAEDGRVYTHLGEDERQRLVNQRGARSGLDACGKHGGHDGKAADEGEASIGN